MFNALTIKDETKIINILAAEIKKLESSNVNHNEILELGKIIEILEKSFNDLTQKDKNKITTILAAEIKRLELKDSIHNEILDLGRIIEIIVKS